MKLTLVAGARPNFMKIAPIIRAIENHNDKSTNKIEYDLVHTGQHYDDKLSKIFFEELGIPEAKINLGAGSGSQAEQTAKIMVSFEAYLIANPVDLVVVVGDVTSTMACTIVAKKLGNKVAHVEAGIRSYDMSMPEEINRIVTDSLADYFFTTTEIANDNLQKMGASQDKIFLVGNTMIDSLLHSLNKINPPSVWELENLEHKKYLLLTLHRPSNVDDGEKLLKILKKIDEAAHDYKIIFPIHPRTKIKFSNLKSTFKNIVTIDPLGYFHFIYLVKHAKGIITDSGGVQEETTYLGVPCVTLRPNTERPETVSIGSNELVNEETLSEAVEKVIGDKWKKGGIPKLWDGETANRIVTLISQLK